MSSGQRYSCVRESRLCGHCCAWPLMMPLQNNASAALAPTLAPSAGSSGFVSTKPWQARGGSGQTSRRFGEGPADGAPPALEAGSDAPHAVRITRAQEPIRHTKSAYTWAVGKSIWRRAAWNALRDESNRRPRSRPEPLGHCARRGVWAAVGDSGPRGATRGCPPTESSGRRTPLLQPASTTSRRTSSVGVGAATRCSAHREGSGTWSGTLRRDILRTMPKRRRGRTKAHADEFVTARAMRSGSARLTGSPPSSPNRITPQLA